MPYTADRVLDSHRLETVELLLEFQTGSTGTRVRAGHREPEAIEQRAKLFGGEVVVSARRLDFL